MKNLLGSIFLLLILVGPAVAQDVLPPDGSRLIASGPDGVLLQWPGNARDRYFVQIYSSGVPAVEQEVTGNSIAVPLRGGLGYQWKVSRVEPSGGYSELVTNLNFQVLTENAMVLTGANGGDGRDGSSRTGYVGEDGRPGGPGPNLTATLQPMGLYVGLTVTGAPANRQLLFAPGSGPIMLASRGGQGGAGGAGADGSPAFFNVTTGYVTLPQPGGNGGMGGAGGPGGSITVISNGLEPARYLQFDTSGGPGGAAGPPGRGGDRVSIPVDWRYGLPYGYADVPAPNGQPGQPGQNGQAGQVFLR